ncbi:MAG: 16S rRNA (cytosine(1402)-N(4))-methyltransferase RsmH [Lachnospiraceae bacterium]|nr:16S rRNA (cytosine(1402)-N(4))-methyltransferase RsmH [Lachnospiraceae bacterium]
MAQEFRHLSVLPEEVIEGLKIDPSGIYVDGTLGGGGHAFLVAEKLSRGGKLIGIDRDAEAIEAAAKRLEPFMDRVTIVKGNYENTKQILSDLGIDKVNGILLDLGVSSYQFDNKDRGFSYREDAPLDMRMDRSDVMTAYDVVNTYSENELCRILKDYGEEKFAKNIAARIVKNREIAPIRTTFELTETIKASIPARFRETGGHPSKKTFQAIRIEVNRELDILKNVIGDLIDLLAPGGRLCIISFHSLEDRIVKQAFKEAEDPCICPPDFPVCVCGRKSKGSVVTRKPVTAGEEELGNNQRAHSAKLRIFEKTEA